jgi:hypothetical protein
MLRGLSRGEIGEAHTLRAARFAGRCGPRRPAGQCPWELGPTHRSANLRAMIGGARERAVDLVRGFRSRVRGYPEVLLGWCV